MITNSYSCANEQEPKTFSPCLLNRFAGLTILLTILVLVLQTPATASAKAKFPVYQDIGPHVQFWEKVYSRYTSSQGILHDKDNPGIIYTVINFVDWSLPGSARTNKALIQQARDQYRDILTELSSGKKPATREEKKVASMFPRRRHSIYLKARENMRLQIGQKDHFSQSVIHSGLYLPMIKKIFKKEGLPLELAYLPHVESSFNPYAHSKAGAVGLWQFTRATGKKYLRIDHIVDERYDPWLSTKAAARLLKENYQQLGTWPLALTAYNYGRAGMVRAVRKRKTYLNIFKYHNQGRFGFASRNFYSEFIAALRIARRLEKNHTIIRDRPGATLSVRMRGYSATRDILRYFKLAEEDFSRLNPALQLPVLEGRKLIPRGYLLRLPATRNIRRKIKKMGKRLYHAHQLRDTIYVVQKGDTVSALAKKYQLPVKELMRANNLRKKGTIKVGQKLKIPPKKRTITRLVVLSTQAKQKVR